MHPAEDDHSDPASTAASEGSQSSHEDAYANLKALGAEGVASCAGEDTASPASLSDQHALSRSASAGSDEEDQHDSSRSASAGFVEEGSLLGSTSSSSLQGIHSTGSLEQVDPAGQTSKATDRDSKQLDEPKELPSKGPNKSSYLLEPMMRQGGYTASSSESGQSEGKEQLPEKPPDTSKLSGAGSQEEGDQGTDSNSEIDQGSSVLSQSGEQIELSGSSLRPQKADQASSCSESTISATLSHISQIEGKGKNPQQQGRDSLDLLATASWQDESPLESARSADHDASLQANRDPTSSESSFSASLADDTDGPLEMQILHFSDQDLLSSGCDLDSSDPATPILAKRRSSTSGMIRGTNFTPEAELDRNSEANSSSLMDEDFGDKGSLFDSRFKILDSMDVSSDTWEEQNKPSSLSEASRMQSGLLSQASEAVEDSDISTGKMLQRSSSEAEALELVAGLRSRSEKFGSEPEPEMDNFLTDLMSDLNIQTGKS